MSDRRPLPPRENLPETHTSMPIADIPLPEEPASQLSRFSDLTEATTGGRPGGRLPTTVPEVRSADMPNQYSMISQKRGERYTSGMTSSTNSTIQDFQIELPQEPTIGGDGREFQHSTTPRDPRSSPNSRMPQKRDERQPSGMASSTNSTIQDFQIELPREPTIGGDGREFQHSTKPRLSNIVAHDVAETIRSSTRDDQAIKDRERQARLAVSTMNAALQTSDKRLDPAEEPSEKFTLGVLSTEQEERGHLSEPPRVRGGRQDSQAAGGAHSVLRGMEDALLKSMTKQQTSQESPHTPGAHAVLRSMEDTLRKGTSKQNTGPSPLLTSSTTGKSVVRGGRVKTDPAASMKGSHTAGLNLSVLGPAPVFETASAAIPTQQAETLAASAPTGAADSDSKRAAASGPTNNVLVGAVGVLGSGLTVQQRPAALANHPRGMSTATLRVPSLQPPRDATTVMNRPVDIVEEDAEEDKPDKVQELPTVDVISIQDYMKKEQREELAFYKRRWFLVALGLFLVLAAGIGVGVAVSGGGDEDVPNVTPRPPSTIGPSPMPTLRPTMAPVGIPPTEFWDAARRDASEFHIVESFQLTDRDTLYDFRSPQFAAWAWLVNEDMWSVITEPAEEMDSDEIRIMMNRYVLAVVYYSLEGSEWVDNEQGVDWLQVDELHCNWRYVGCDSASIDVTEIVTGGRPGADVSGGAANMRGKLPDELKFFQGLTSFRVPGNSIYNVDALTPDFASLSILDLAGNPLEGHGSIFELPAISTLSVQACGLEGPVPSMANLTQLLSFSLSDNQFSGVITSEFSAKGLRDMVMARNLLEGDIMDVLQNQEALLRVFQVQSNRLTGSLAPSFGNFTALNTFDVSDNDLSGTLPTELGLLTQFSAEMSFAGNARIEGTLPTEMGLLSNMKSLSLALTFVEGTIPEEWSGMSSLQNLDLTATFVSGTVPESFCSLPSLTTITRASSMDCTGCSKCL